MKKGFLITSLSLAAIALVSCATSNINPVATDNSATTNTPINDNGSNAVNKVTVEISMNGEAKYDVDYDFCTFEVRPGTLWRAAKENFDFTKVTYDQYRSFKMFSFKSYADDEVPDSYVVEDDVTLYVRYIVDIPPESLCTVNWYNTDPKQEARELLMEPETYGVGEKPVYRGPDPEIFNPTVGHKYRFIGWDPEPTTLTAPGEYNYVAKYFDITEEHTVTFDYQYDGIVNRVMVKHGDTVEPIEPVRTGWTFGGWYETPECSGDPFNFNTPITANKTLYAKWTQDECVVTFYDDYYLEPTVWRTVTVKYGEKVVPPESPTKEHFDFNMWVDINGVQFDFNTPIIAATNLYATYVPSLYTITFDMNGAPFYIDPITVSYGIAYDLPDPQHWDGHTFTGWKYKGGGSVEDPENFYAEADTTLVASWTQQTCKVTFDWEDGVYSTETTKEVNYGERVAPITPTYEGHSFKYWSDSWVSPSPFNFDQPITHDIELYAIWDDVYFTVTFSCNGGHFPESSATTTTRSVIYGGTIPDLPGDRPDDPVRDGYSFNGWYDSDGNEFEFGVTILATQVYSDMDIHAAWNKASDRTVDFYVDGDLYVSKKVGYGEKVSRPDDPSKPGYKFDAWYEDGNKFNFDTAITKDHDLYAVWSDPESCTVTFIANGGAPAPNPQSVSYGYTINEPAPMTRDGFTFGGWFKEPNFSGEQYNFATPVTSSFNLYAKWDPVDAIVVHFVNYDSTSQDVSVPYGQRVIPVTPKDNPGHTFLGWYKGETEFDFDTPITEETTLYAKWSEDVEQCTVTFVSNGGSPAVITKTVNYGETMQAPSEPEREGYDFEGWYSNEELTPESKFDFPATITSSFILYAKWTPKGSLTVTFYTAVGEQYLEPVIVEYGTRVNRPVDPTKEGHDFLGWYDNSACTGDPFDFNTSITDNLNLYAKWSGIEMCIVTFVSNGGTIIEPKTVEYGSVVTKPDPDPTKDGYIFGGWYTDQELTDVYNFNTPVTSSFNLYAKWDPVGAITVHFVDYDSTSQDVSVPYGQRVVAVDPKPKLGYTFLGWYKDETKFDFNTPITEETTLNAKWSDEKIEYIVTFISNGGSLVSPTKVKYEEKVSAPEPPTRYGYNFGGWYTDQELTEVYDFNTPVTSSFNLYAKWDKKGDCTVTFMDNTETFATVTVAYGDKVTPVDPTKEGFIFDGWYKDQQLTELFDFEHTHIESETYIYGKWTEIPPIPTDQITVTFNPNGGTYVPSIDIEPGSTIAEEPECIREGYKLDGWYYAPTGGIETEFEFGVTRLYEDTMLTAKWIKLSRGQLINLMGNDQVKVSIGPNYDPYNPPVEYGIEDVFYFDETVNREFNVHTIDKDFLKPGQLYGVIINGKMYDCKAGEEPASDECRYDTTTGTLYLPTDLESTNITSLVVVVDY